MKLMVNVLIEHLRQLCQQTPNPRTDSNTLFCFDDIVMAAFSVFFLKSLYHLEVDYLAGIAPILLFPLRYTSGKQ